MREERKVMGTGHLLETQSASFLCPRNRAILLHADSSCIGSPSGPPEPGKSCEVPSVSFDKAAVGLPAGVRWIQKSGCSNYCLACWCCLAG